MVKVTLTSPLSHHDPDQPGDSNVSLFRRQKQHVKATQTGRLPSQEEIDALCEAFPVPMEAAMFFRDLALPEFIATALVKSFITKHKGEGEGLFEGMERYRRLEERAQQSAVQAGTCRAFWGLLCRSMEVPGAVGRGGRGMMQLLATPATIGQQVLRCIARTPGPVVMQARFWDEQERLASPEYAASADEEPTSGETETLSFDADALTDASDTLTVEVPTYSANSLRHELVREPAMWHLYDRLGLDFDEPTGARTSIFYNGGDLKTSGSASIFWKRKRARTAYPVLALLSGATDSFILGESNLNVHAWLVCKENNRELERVGMESDTSAFDLLDQVTHTRHSGRLGGDGDSDNQMLFTFETLVPGAEIVVEFSLSPYAQPLEEGALLTALEHFQQLDGTLGGQSARGYGQVDFEMLHAPDDVDAEDVQAAYEDHLEENRDDLREGIMEGTLCTGKEIISG